MRGAFLAFAFALFAAPAVAQDEREAEPPHPMEGEWTVDLRLNIGDEPYSQPMVLRFSHANQVTGEFYGSPIEAGQLGSGQGRDCIAFRTSDNSGVYQHSACLIGAVLVGQSWSEGRGFVLPWTATKD
ncbi:hypothetical protein [Aurantiacibacter sediminis]|uniref:Uncharacterized protein n=1 Tax=Aurantiacibacter sediminis TaxID=2793064 RepID=A0ABS0N5H1_9SPHN|nr:hypothetical protein [Aurantiacibacter sediminis]MBH5323039.1 hypothetical protein [Aurantiacibacter sediminis]